jgi:hypothetical protein
MKMFIANCTEADTRVHFRIPGIKDARFQSIVALSQVQISGDLFAEEVDAIVEQLPEFLNGACERY